MLTQESQVGSLLVHNNERLEQICRVLSEEKVSANDRLLAVREDIQQLHACETLSLGRQLEEDVDKLFGTARRILGAYRECREVESTDMNAHLETIVASTRDTDPNSIYEALKRMTDILQREVRVEKQGSEIDEIVLRFIEFASRPAVALESHLRADTSRRQNKTAE